MFHLTKTRTGPWIIDLYCSTFGQFFSGVPDLQIQPQKVELGAQLLIGRKNCHFRWDSDNFSCIFPRGFSETKLAFCNEEPLPNLKEDEILDVFHHCSLWCVFVLLLIYWQGTPCHTAMLSCFHTAGTAISIQFATAYQERHRWLWNKNRIRLHWSVSVCTDPYQTVWWKQGWSVRLHTGCALQRWWSS